MIMNTLDRLAEAHIKFLKTPPRNLHKPDTDALYCLLFSICDHLLFGEELQVATGDGRGSNRGKPPRDFETLSTFVEETGLASQEWLGKTFRNYGDDSCFKKFGHCWYVNRENLINWFIENDADFKILAARCKRYKKKLKK